MSTRKSTRKRPSSSNPELGNQKKRNPVPGKSIPIWENMSERLKLLQMTKKNTQSMSSYYQELKLQAEKCGINCCQDIIIRDRLIQAITEEAVLQEIIRMHNPTASEVFAKYSEIVQGREVFSLVLPYLILSDMASLIKTSPRLEKIVRSYVEQGGNITIDEHVLSNFPVQTNRDFYLKFKDAPSVTWVRIAEADIPELLSCFKHIWKFTMRDMQILDNIRSLPRSLTELYLIRVQIEEPLTKVLLLNTKDTLKTLHLEEVLTIWGKSYEGLFDLNELCPNLSSLVVKNKLNEHCEGPLKVCSERPPHLIVRLPSKLESLYYDRYCYLNLSKLTGLRFLTLRDFPGASIPKIVEFLKILNAYDFNRKETFDNLNIKSLDITYYNEPVTDLPSTNLILDTLNDDCILKVLRFLNLRDCMSFAKVHPRFERLIIKHTIPNMEDFVDSDKLYRNREFWIKAGPFLKYLKPYHLSSDELLWLLPFCTGLERLNFLFLKNTECEIFKTQLSNQLIRNPNQMNKLQELSVNTVVDLNCLLNILHRNKDTLRAFTFNVIKGHDWDRYQTIWEVVGEMDHIEEICISHNAHLKQILSLFGKKLKRLTMRGLGDLIHLLADAHNQMPKLQELQLSINYHTKEDWTTISSLKQLTHLTIDFYYYTKSKDSDILQLIKSLPKLIDLTIYRHYFSLPLQFGIALRKFLLQENRSLCLTLK